MVSAFLPVKKSQRCA